MNAPDANGPEIPRSDIEDETAVRAYERWVARGRPNGTQLQVWIEAEVEVRRLKDLAQRSREADTPLCDPIAESGRGENQLWISEDVGQRLFDGVPDAIMVVRRDRRIAREIQQGLLPKTMPTLRGFTICGRSSFADEVGGDCFDFIPAFI